MTILQRWFEEQYDAAATAESNPFLFFVLCLIDMKTARSIVPSIFPKGSPAISAWLNYYWEPLDALHWLVEEHEFDDFAELRRLLHAPPVAPAFLMPPTHMVEILNHFYSNRIPEVPLLVVLRGSTKGMTKTQASEMRAWIQSRLEKMKTIELVLPGWDFYDFFEKLEVV